MFWVVTIPPRCQQVRSLRTRPVLKTARRFPDRRLLLLPRHAQARRQDPARRRLRPEIAVGTFYAPNISPDPNEGIGKWSEANFVTAMVKGTSPDGRHYFPAFPYTSYQRMGTGDLRDLFAYLRTLPAVQDKSKPHDVPFPFNIRRTLGC